MGLPGPATGELAIALLAWAGTAVALGELVRYGVARYVHAWSLGDPIERGLLDFFLGGALLYLVAAVPLGLFVAPIVLGLPIVAGLGLLLVVARDRAASARSGETVARSFGQLLRPPYLLTAASALALFVIELAIATPVGTGNTFDSGLLTTYVALLLDHHMIPLSFSPYASPAILYPQGTTVWLGWAQIALGLPAARTSLLVTPLFIALAPLGGFVFGRRWFGSERAGLAFALTMAWLAPMTRGMVQGSNDFVFAFPLVLLLAGEANTWFRAPGPGRWDALGFGLLAGYSAAMNPVGVEWLVPTVLIGLLVVGPFSAPALGRRLGVWLVATATSLVGVLPSLYILALGHASPGFVPGAAAPPAGTPTGITASEFLGSIDPFLFRPGDTQLSPVTEIRAELAVLLVVGLALLLLVRRGSELERYLAGFRRFAIVGAGVLVALLALIWAAAQPIPIARVVAAITSSGELSILLFALYVFVAALPLVLAVERCGSWFDRHSREGDAGPGFRRRRRDLAAFDPKRAVLALGVALVIVVPGVAVTAVTYPPMLAPLYHDLGNVTADDLELLAFAGSYLPAGARVLIAPGSAADFLPGYTANVVLLYPLIPGFEWTNRSYNLVVEELSNATLDVAGRAAITALAVQYILVTGASTTLWPPFSPAPLLAAPTAFPLVREYGDAYLFAVAGAG